MSLNFPLNFRLPCNVSVAHTLFKLKGGGGGPHVPHKTAAGQATQKIIGSVSFATLNVYQ